LISLYQEMQRLKFLVEFNYIGTNSQHFVSDLCVLPISTSIIRSFM
jgi:hypothetical protein